MRRMLFLAVFLPCVAFSSPQLDSIAILRDSIAKLNRKPLMTEAQFVKLYKYERLARYYRICKRKPSQWKYYKGWSIRVFEQ